MPGTTTINGLRYAVLTDPANAKTMTQNLAVDADDNLVPRFASSATRNSAMPFPVDGALAYTTDSGVLWVYRSELAAWVWFAPMMSVSTADQSRTSSTTFTTYTSLVGIKIEANRQYDFKVQAGFTGVAGGDLKVAFLLPSAGYVEFGFIGAPLGTSAGLGNQGYTQRSGSASTSVGIGIYQCGGSPQSFSAFGRIINGGASGTLVLQFAQNTSNAAASWLLLGTKLEVVAVV